tara:strand:+ start:1132 stop:2355 length:1224 start_codon:yes stop_codon:yes gene_type:complete
MYINVSNSDFFRERISDFDHFMAQIPDILTEHGGFIAGGILRRAVLAGSFFAAFNSRYITIHHILNAHWMGSVNDPFAKRTNIEAYQQLPDIDIYFRTKLGYETTLAKIKTSGGLVNSTIQTSRYAKTINASIVLKNPSTGEHLVVRPNIQLVGDMIDHGDPKRVLASFDILNCAIAYDPNEQLSYFDYAALCDTLQINTLYPDELHSFRVSKYLKLYNNKISKDSVKFLQTWAEQKIKTLHLQLAEEVKPIKYPNVQLKNFLNLVADPTLAHIFSVKHYLPFTAMGAIFSWLRTKLAEQNKIVAHFGESFMANDCVVKLTPEFETLLISWWKQLDVKIPEINMVSMPIVAKSRKLKAKWIVNPAVTAVNINTAHIDAMAQAIDDHLFEDLLNNNLKEVVNESKTTP